MSPRKPDHGEAGAPSAPQHKTTLAAVPAMSERAWQQVVLELAAMYRWSHYHVFDSRRSQPGFPDLVLWRERLLFAELKATDGRLTLLQRQVVTGLRQAGQRVFVWRPEDLDQVKVELAWRDGGGYPSARNVAVKGERL